MAMKPNSDDKPIVRASSSMNEQLSLQAKEFFKYLEYKVPIITAAGGVTGSILGFYWGNATALYGYTYGFGGGIAGTAFYTGVYGLQLYREKDDAINYAISGGFNSAWIVSGLSGFRRGAVAAIIGSVAGAAYKVTGEFVYGESRKAWLDHRRKALYESTPRTMTYRRPQFPPRENKSGVTGGVVPNIIPPEFRKN